MIRPFYASKLARVKLRSKRGMLFTAIIISSVLFSVLFAAIIVFTAAEKSTVAFVKEANNNEYLVKVRPVTPGGVVIGLNPVDLTAEDIKSIRTYEAEYYDALEKKYNDLRISYVDPSPNDSLLTPNALADPSVPSSLRYRLNFSSPLMREFERTRFISYASTAKNKLDNLKDIVSKYEGSGFYRIGNVPLPSIPNQLLILNGKEALDSRDVKTGDATLYGYTTNAIHNSMYELQDQRLVSRYITHKDANKLAGIPVIVSAQEAAKLFGKDKGIEAEPEDARAKQAWMHNIQEKLTGYTYQTCYRNETEQGLLAKIQQDYADIEAHKNDKDYVKPSLTYAYPSEPCGDISIASDTRTEVDKDRDAQQIENQKKLGNYEPSNQHIITYQIVGFMMAEPYSNATQDVSSYLRNLLSYQTDLMGAIIPLQMYQSSDVSKKISEVLPAEKNSEYLAAVNNLSPRVIAFPTVNQARNFMNNEACPPSDTECKKLFTAEPYGSNYLILDEVGKMFRKFMLYALPVVMALAAITVWFMMSRVMTDNRKETAVYRAMGAKRIDIAAIYLLYTLIIAVCIATTSLLIGGIVALILDNTYGKELGAVATNAFGVIDSEAQDLSLFDVTSPILLYVYLAIIVLCFAAVLQPLLRNILRSPIRDMRAE